MERNGKKIAKNSVSKKTLRNMEKYKRLAEVAVEEARAENRRLGIPNWYSVNGKITNDQESGNGLKDNSKKHLPQKTSGKITR